jgi:hypothetical protein
MITSIDNVQTNITGDCNLISLHNPVVFTAQANYSGIAPEYIDIDIYDDLNVMLGTYRCIPWLDISTGVRQFIFIADKILRGLMDDFDEFIQSDNSIAYCDGSTKVFKLQFKRYQEATAAIFTIVALQGVRQFGQNPAIESVFNNESQIYIGASENPIYFYFYNDDVDNIIATTEGYSDRDSFVEYNGDDFIDFDDSYFIGM